MNRNILRFRDIIRTITTSSTMKRTTFCRHLFGNIKLNINTMRRHVIAGTTTNNHTNRSNLNRGTTLLLNIIRHRRPSEITITIIHPRNLTFAPRVLDSSNIDDIRGPLNETVILLRPCRPTAKGLLLGTRSIFSNNATRFMGTLIIVTRRARITIANNRRTSRTVLNIINILVFIRRRVTGSLLVPLRRHQGPNGRLRHLISRIIGIRNVHLHRLTLMRQVDLDRRARTGIYTISMQNNMLLKKCRLILNTTSFARGNLIAWNFLISIRLFRTHLRRPATIVNIVSNRITKVTRVLPFTTRRPHARKIRNTNNCFVPLLPRRVSRSFFRLTNNLVNGNSNRSPPKETKIIYRRNGRLTIRQRLTNNTNARLDLLINNNHKSIFTLVPATRTSRINSTISRRNNLTTTHPYRGR